MIIYCDMDGVLCDFITPAIEKVNSTLNDEQHRLAELAGKVKDKIGRDYIVNEDLGKFNPKDDNPVTRYMYELLDDDVDFWANLPWNTGGKAIWNSIKKHKPRILTSPMDKLGKKGSIAGKKIWLEKNCGIRYDDDPERVNFSHQKYKFAVQEDFNLLIDDWGKNIHPWRECGGIAIKHENHHGGVKKTVQQIGQVLSTHDIELGTHV